MVTVLIVLVVAFYFGVGLFLESKLGQIIESILLDLASIPALIIIGLCKVLRKTKEILWQVR